MNAKQRRARVQGGWAPPKNVKSDQNKPKAQIAPNWYGKNIDQPIPEKKFVYEETSEVRFVCFQTKPDGTTLAHDCTKMHMFYFGRTTQYTQNFNLARNGYPNQVIDHSQNVFGLVTLLPIYPSVRRACLQLAQTNYIQMIF